MAIKRPIAVVSRKYETSGLNASVNVTYDSRDSTVLLNIDGQWFDKQDLIELRDLLNEFIEVL